MQRNESNNEAYLLKTESVYEGYWKEGFYDGKGSEKTLINGRVDSSYDGYWKKGLFHGQGIYNSVFGKYEGEWNNGLLNGYATLEAHRYGYKGQWKEGLYHGYGEEWRYESTYKGFFFRGKWHGKGNYYYGRWREKIWKMSDLVFEGEFKQGLAIKHGIYKVYDGRVFISMGKINPYIAYDKGRVMIPFRREITLKGRYKCIMPDGLESIVLDPTF